MRGQIDTSHILCYSLILRSVSRLQSDLFSSKLSLHVKISDIINYLRIPRNRMLVLKPDEPLSNRSPINVDYDISFADRCTFGFSRASFQHVNLKLKSA